jgi:hypothetical protein
MHLLAAVSPNAFSSNKEEVIESKADGSLHSMLRCMGGGARIKCDTIGRMTYVIAHKFGANGLWSTKNDMMIVVEVMMTMMTNMAMMVVMMTMMVVVAVAVEEVVAVIMMMIMTKKNENGIGGASVQVSLKGKEIT